MTKAIANSLACAVAVVALGSPGLLRAQLEIGTWVRQAEASTPAMTMQIEACCGGGGRRLTYHIVIEKTETSMVIETRLDGRDAPVMVGGKPSAESMAITRVDALHASTVVKMNGAQFATSLATLSADGKTLTVVTDNTSAAGGQPVGKVTEVWVRK
jgi:hypothetical protein